MEESHCLGLCEKKGVNSVWSGKAYGKTSRVLNPQTQPRVIAELVGHDRRYLYVTLSKTQTINGLSRVTALQTITIQLSSLGSQPRRPVVVACTAFSDGKIRLFDLALIPEDTRENKGPVQIDPVAEYDTKGTRLTCIAVAEGDDEDEGEGGEVQAKAAVGKRKREEEDKK